MLNVPNDKVFTAAIFRAVTKGASVGRMIINSFIKDYEYTRLYIVAHCSLVA